MMKEMKTTTHLKPGQRGTKHLTEQYGDALLCVRYRTDEKRGVRLKTVELIVEEKPIKVSGRYYRDDETVYLVITYGESALRDRLKIQGGRWNPAKKLWQVTYGAIRDHADLTERIVPEKLELRHGRTTMGKE
jgi:hypothetical protein